MLALIEEVVLPVFFGSHCCSSRVILFYFLAQEAENMREYDELSEHEASDTEAGDENTAADFPTEQDLKLLSMLVRNSHRLSLSHSNTLK